MPPVDADIGPPVRDRYTLDGDAAVEARIARDQARIGAAVATVVQPHELRAVVLMGGYGRGEGGYVVRGSGPEPYNDYDYFVVVRGVGRGRGEALGRALAGQARALEHEVGVEVDFALLREERLARAEHSLMNAEMLWGHRVILGDPDVLRAMPAMPFARLPLGEFTRLLLNRGALLLMNQKRLASQGPLAAAEQEVFFKYLFKAVLACGDARLAGERVYHPSYVRKIERLRALEWPGQPELMDLYAPAWESKFHPDYAGFAQEDTERWQRRVAALWLDTLAWLEGVRTGTPVDRWEAYCSPGLPKGQSGGSWGWLRNAAVTLRDFGPAELVRRPRWSLRYPRERLISALPLLLSQPQARATPPVAEALALAAGTPWRDTAEAFLRLWRRYA